MEKGVGGRKERETWMGRVGEVFFMKLLLFCRAENQISKNHTQQVESSSRC